MKAIQMSRPGGPEVLQLVDVPRPTPGPGQALVKAHYIGVNMPELHVRRGRYSTMPPLPTIPGIEMSGTAKRSACAPELPTISESGVPGYTAQQWWGMFAPAGTPNGVVSSIHAQVTNIFAADDIKRRLSAQGAEPAPMSPSDFNGFVGREVAMWTKVVKERGIRPE